MTYWNIASACLLLVAATLFYILCWRIHKPSRTATTVANVGCFIIAIAMFVFVTPLFLFWGLAIVK